MSFGIVCVVEILNNSRNYIKCSIKIKKMYKIDLNQLSILVFCTKYDSFFVQLMRVYWLNRIIS